MIVLAECHAHFNIHQPPKTHSLVSGIYMKFNTNFNKFRTDFIKSGAEKEYDFSCCRITYNW